jgi:hypothetical protein
MKRAFLSWLNRGIGMVVVSCAAHRRVYSFFTALRAPSFIHIYTNKHTFPLPQLVQAVTGGDIDRSGWLTEDGG